MRLDLNLLRLFEAIYSGGGVSRAAEVLNLTQPAVSHALNRLRDQLGDPLFVRLGQGLTPTATAHKLIGPIRKALGDIELAVKNVQNFDPAHADMRFRIGFNALMEEPLFPVIAAGVMAQAPGIGLESVRYVRSEMAVALASSQLNAVIDIDMPVAEAIHCQKIWSGRIIAIAGAHHPVFAKQGQGVSMDDYMAMRHVVVSTRPRGASIEDIALARETIRHRTIAARCQLIGSALDLVRQSDLVLTVAAAFVDEARLGADLRVFSLPLDLPLITVQLYWHASNDADQAHIWLRQRISEMLARNQLGEGKA